MLNMLLLLKALLGSVHAVPNPGIKICYQTVDCGELRRPRVKVMKRGCWISSAPSTGMDIFTHAFSFSDLCRWQLLQVFIQSARRMYERSLCPVPGYDRRQYVREPYILFAI